jgi:hypothetical protein
MDSILIGEFTDHESRREWLRRQCLPSSAITPERGSGISTQDGDLRQMPQSNPVGLQAESPSKTLYTMLSKRHVPKPIPGNKIRHALASLDKFSEHGVVMTLV